jgi:cytochrome oxidase Cu insertion factor (SCO1/SenC/PrrC family)/cytochrome c2
MPFGSNFPRRKQMKRRLLPVPLWSAITIVATVIVSIALAVLSPALRTQSLSPLPGAAVAAAPDDSQRTAEGPSQVAPEAQSGAAASQTSGNRWGANYFPNLPVIDQNGRTLHFYDDVIKGKIVVISFIYTSCQDLCPLTTAKMAQIEDKLDGAVGRDLFFVSMSVDPENDTPERMKAFADAFDVGPGWLFLTGKLEDIRAINYKLGDRSDRNLSDHRNEIVLGNDAGGYWQRASVFGDLDSLVISIRQMNPVWLNEVHPPQREQLDVKKYMLSNDQAGQILFKRICAPCHTIGVGDRVGPDLRDVTARRDRAWLTSFIQNPKKMFADKDPIVLAMAEKFPGVRMPVLGISDTDAQELLSYLDDQSARIVDAAPSNAPSSNRHHHH